MTTTPAEAPHRDAVPGTSAADTASAPEGRARRVSVRAGALLLTVAVVCGLCVLSVAIGSRSVGWDDILAGIAGHTDTFEQAAVFRRVPRTLLALVVGAALGLAGAVMQGVTRNPLADPGILGVNSGAALAVVLGMAVFGLSSAFGFIWVAIVGAALSAAFVYGIASLGTGGPTPLKLVLSGTATAAAMTSFVSAIVLPRGDIAENVQQWQIGGVGGGTFEKVGAVLPFLVVGFLLCLVCAQALNSLALGDELAAGLGEKPALVRGIAATGAVVLCGTATAVAGPIGFVGLVVPHVCRLLLGPDHRRLLPFSALSGAGLLVAADVLGRIVARPAEIQVGIITALVGAPFLIWIVRRTKVREL
ncbi:FecCD family ABC transporter permease [Brevibacterium samyangense]|uniref:Iron ABC transporter permease n=1 Tax=Brevibacterium samyangense TaxID=366888 RepID=A0ABP5F214_9MICO